MADPIKQRYAVGNVNGVPDYTTVNTSNIPSGYQEIDQGSFVTGLQSFLDKGGGVNDNDPGVLQGYKNMLNNAKTGYNPNPLIASAVNPMTGETLTNVSQKTLDELTAQKEGVATGKMKDLGNGLTVPTGSPADVLRTNPAQYAKQNGGQGVPGYNPPGTFEQVKAAQYPTDANFSDKFQQGFQAAKDSGTTAPTTSEGAYSMFNNFLSSDQSAKIDNFVSQDPYLNSVMAGYQQFMSSQNQQASLVDTYKQMLQESGIEGIDTDLINIDNVMKGNEEMIRNEVTKAGGFATEGQVLALTNARNKTLLQQYNKLLDTRNAKSQYLDTMMNLTEQDRTAANQRFETQMNFGFKIAEINQTMKKNAVETIDRVAKTVGWDGVYQATQGNSQMIAQIERTYGLPTGSLAIAAQRDAEIRTNKAQMDKLELEQKQSAINLSKTQIEKAQEDIKAAPLERQFKTEQIKTEQAQRSNIYSQISERAGKSQEEQAKQTKLIESQVGKANIVLQKVNEASKIVSGFSTGLSALTGFIPGTPAKNLQSKINTIKANLSFDTLQEMRNNSPTGGALGQTSDREIELLGSTVASLDTGQSEKQLRQSLTDVQTHYINWLATVGYTVTPNGDIIQIK